MRRLIPWGLALIVVGLTVWAFRPVPVPVELAVIGPQDITVTVEEEGQARIREVYAVSAPIAGRLQRIGLHAGDPVTAGQTVVAAIGPAEPALLDSRARAVAEAGVAAAQAAVDLAGAQLAQARAAADFARSDAERSATLFDRATISRRLLDQTLLEAETAEATVTSAEAELAVRARELDSARAMLAIGTPGAQPDCCVSVLAPVSGRVLRVLVTSEQMVPSGASLLEIGDPAAVEIVTDLLSRDAVRVTPGAMAEVYGWGGPPLTARVLRVSPSAETQVSALGIDEQRVEVVLEPVGAPEDRIALGHGFRVMVRIAVWQGQGVVAVPVGALFRDGADWAVYVAQDGRAELRPLMLGERNADAAQVLQGLVAGEQVLLHPSDRVAPGVRIAP